MMKPYAYKKKLVCVEKKIKKIGKTLYVPKIRSKNGGMDFLRCYSTNDLASFPAGTWGIREPGDLWEGQNRSTSESLSTIPPRPPSPREQKKKKNSLSEDFAPPRIVLSCTAESLDVILLPGKFYFILFYCVFVLRMLTSFCYLTPSSGVAFDRSLSRLGHGKGYYDRFISSYIASGRNKPLLSTFIFFPISPLRVKFIMGK